MEIKPDHPDEDGVDQQMERSDQGQMVEMKSMRWRPDEADEARLCLVCASNGKNPPARAVALHHAITLRAVPRVLQRHEQF